MPSNAPYYLTVTTPWYPQPHNVMGGSFVAEHAALMAHEPSVQTGGGVRVVHAAEWPAGSAEAVAGIQPAVATVLAHLRRDDGTVVGGYQPPLHRIPVATVGGASVAQRAEAMAQAALQSVGAVHSPVVHGHVGYSGGVMAMRLADPQAAVFATEHSTGLVAALSEPATRDHYQELLDRAQAVYCVSGVLRDQVLQQCTDARGVVQVLPNPVDFDVPCREKMPEKLNSWLFVGGLIERKGVLRLTRAFTVAAREDPEVTLTMVGTGPLADQVHSIARDAGVGDRLTMLGVLPHDQVQQLMPTFDLLVAPSTYETFHLAVPEAVAAGVPVVVTRSGGPQEALAGVENLVGRFIDVHDSPDELVEAWRDLNANLDTLDLPGAQAALRARYGRAAIADHLARNYAAAVDAQSTPASPRSETVTLTQQREPGRLVLVAATGWRRYSIQAQLDMLAQRDAAEPGALLVTDDVEQAEYARGLGIGVCRTRELGVKTPQPRLSLRARLGRYRRVAQQWWRHYTSRGSSTAPAASAQAPSTRTTIDAERDTIVLGDCQAMPLVAELITRQPQLRVITEVPATGQ